jgi:ATP-dependent Clp protease ATP-binding subunit ClpC
MEDSIHERIIGQKTRVVSVSKARRARVGLRDPNRPIASLYSGPTGVGKPN